MNTLILTATVSTAMMTISTSNPVMMSLLLVFLSTISMAQVHSNLGSSWFPLLFYLLFMGGIIVMFLVLSSLTPNQPMSKKFSFKLMVVMMLMSTFLIYPMMEMNQTPSVSVLGSKAALGEATTFSIMTFLILLYFMILSSLILEIEAPLRSESCHTKKNFVNF